MEVEKQVQNLRLEDVLPNRFQPRIKFSEDSINELANSIKEHGVIQPIVVRRIGDKYEIIAGERRYKASQIAGKETIPAIISDLDDSDSAEIALLENVQRENLTPIEEAISYKKILDMGYTQEQLAQKIGNKQSTIANKVRLLNLTDEVQEALLENRISERHARSLLKISNSDLQVKMLGRIIAGRFTVRKTDEEIDKLLKGELDMNENNEVLTTIPTSKIYEEETPKVEETLKIEDAQMSNPIYNEVPVAPIPLEVEEKVEPIVPIKIEQQVKEQTFDTKFLEKETFVNMPMHNIPTVQPFGENSEYRDGKYFELEKQKEEVKIDNTFNDVFGASTVTENRIPVEKIESDELIMPTFDFSNVSPLDNIETVSFGEEVPVATPSFTSPLTELPTIDDISTITANIPTLEEMSNNFNTTETIPVTSDSIVQTEPIPVENKDQVLAVNDNVTTVPGLESVINSVEINNSQPAISTFGAVEPIDEKVYTNVTPIVENPIVSPVLPTIDMPMSNNIEQTAVVAEQPVQESVGLENMDAPVPIIEQSTVEIPIVNNELPVENEEMPVIREYAIPTFDPENGSSIETVNEDIKPLEVTISEEVVPVVEEKTVSTEIKLPFDSESINSLKNDFLRLLQEKGFNVSVEDMDLADNYKLIFTIEK